MRAWYISTLSTYARVKTAGSFIPEQIVTLTLGDMSIYVRRYVRRTDNLLQKVFITLTDKEYVPTSWYNYRIIAGLGRMEVLDTNP